MMSTKKASLWVRLVLAAAVVLPVAATQFGCSCGMGPDGGSGAAHVDASGALVFDRLPVGETAIFHLTVKDSANVHERILGASFSGLNAGEFAVTGTYPIDVPAGTSVTLDVSFVPTMAGQAQATLLVQTEDMGISPIQVSGTAAPAGS